MLVPFSFELHNYTPSYHIHLFPKVGQNVFKIPRGGWCIEAWKIGKEGIRGSTLTSMIEVVTLLSNDT